MQKTVNKMRPLTMSFIFWLLENNTSNGVTKKIDTHWVATLVLRKKKQKDSKDGCQHAMYRLV